MKRYSRVFGYLGKYKTSIAWYFVAIFLSILFSIVSIGMLAPFMNLIFKQDAIPDVAKSLMWGYALDKRTTGWPHQYQ